MAKLFPTPEWLGTTAANRYNGSNEIKVSKYLAEDWRFSRLKIFLLHNTGVVYRRCDMDRYFGPISNAI